jgi:hypothetical protein
VHRRDVRLPALCALRQVPLFDTGFRGLLCGVDIVLRCMVPIKISWQKELQWLASEFQGRSRKNRNGSSMNARISTFVQYRALSPSTSIPTEKGRVLEGFFGDLTRQDRIRQDPLPRGGLGFREARAVLNEALGQTTKSRRKTKTKT